MNNEKKKSLSVEADLELEPDQKPEVMSPRSVLQQIGLEFGRIGEGASAIALRELVCRHTPKTVPDAIIFLKQLERMRSAAEVAHAAAQEIIGSISSSS